ncbi:hypothetical protein FQN54_003162 [Arachnomyces sp. PD_36]|nr:hypothetical protein FQN54_003162 [Arachnomyces sp. PD_36]
MFSEAPEPATVAGLTSLPSNSTDTSGSPNCKPARHVKVLQDQFRSGYNPDDEPITETPESVAEAGSSILSQIKETTDKNGRFIATDFLELPDRKENPDYYATISLPIALDIIEEKLRQNKYPTVTPLESDLKRMVSNAKFYNEKSSVIFADAERIRKILTTSMPKLNPAYKDPNYVPFPTPLPREAMGGSEATGDVDMDTHGNGENHATEKPTPQRATPKAPNGTAATPAAENGADNNYGFGNDTLQNAEDRIVNEMLALKDDDGQEIAAPFITKPDQRMYKEYYDIIQHPVSLRGIQKRARGIGSKNNPMKLTSFPTWQSFEDEMRYIWRNARQFNEDGSEISILAGKLEEYFEKRIKEAKLAVPDPVQEDGDGSTPRIKLKMGSTSTPEPSSQKLLLKFQGQKGDTTSAENVTPGVTVDSEALKRQQELVRAGSNGQEFPQNATPSSTNLRKRSFGSPQSGPNKKSTPLTRASQERQRSVSATVSSRAVSGIEGEGQSPSLLPVQPVGDGLESSKTGLPEQATRTPSATTPGASTMGPPLSVTPRPQSGSPHPSQPHTQHQTPTFQPPSISPLDCRVRQPGKSPLISNVSVTSHSSLADNDNFHLDIAPLPSDPQQSLTFTLRPIHNNLTIIPTVTPSTAQRQTKLVVSVNFQKLTPMQSGLGPGDTTKPRFEIRLAEGVVTKVDIEMISGPARGAPRTGTAVQDVEYERVTLFAHLMRSY